MAETKLTEAEVAEAMAELDAPANDDADNAPPPPPKSRRKGPPLWDTECAVITWPASFVVLHNRQVLSAKSIDHRYGDIKTEPHKVARHSEKIARYHGLTYLPDDQATVSEDGETLFNLYRAQVIEPLKGNPKLFLDHVTYLIPDQESREWFLDWMAHCIQHPTHKAMFMPLLVGPHGTGKSWFVGLFKALFNGRNVSEPSKKTMASDFNAWASRKQMVCIHELQTKGKLDIPETLKELITQPTIDVNIKNVERFTIPNVANFFAITNDSAAIPIERTERRYLVIQCADEPRHPPGSKEYDRYYDALFSAIGALGNDDPSVNGPKCEEARRILHYLQNRKIKLSMSGFAPKTQAREDMIDAGRNTIEKLTAQALDAREAPLVPVFTLADVLHYYVMSESLPNAERNVNKVQTAVTALGCRPIRTDNGKQRLIRIGEHKVSLWATTPQQAAKLARKSNDELAEMYAGYLAEPTPKADNDDAEDFGQADDAA